MLKKSSLNDFRFSKVAEEIPEGFERMNLAANLPPLPRNSQVELLKGD